jgi:hypothetical protein
MRLTKLAASVLLGIAGLFATIGAVGGWVFDATTCLNAPSGSDIGYVCAYPSAVVTALEWSILAVVLWVSAVAAIRSRGADPARLERDIAIEVAGS